MPTNLLYLGWFTVLPLTSFQFPLASSQLSFLAHWPFKICVTLWQSAFLVSYWYIAFSGFQWRQEELGVFIYFATPATIGDWLEKIWKWIMVTLATVLHQKGIGNRLEWIFKEFESI
jgi:hypothetical protein